ncbi:MAG: hypothetical protein H7263_17845 [Candidatus Sericytochromatia bacterium]|nr:hypothetical protein [Candidatus Sericytochromatia bacterium]
MLSKDIKDKFLNTYFKEDDKVYVTEIYDKWRQKPPQLLKLSYTKDEAVENHNRILKELESKIRIKPER